MVRLQPLLMMTDLKGTGSFLQASSLYELSISLFAQHPIFAERRLKYFYRVINAVRVFFCLMIYWIGVQIEDVVAQWHEGVSVRFPNGGDELLFINIFISSLWHQAKARRWVTPLRNKHTMPRNIQWKVGNGVF